MNKSNLIFLIIIVIAAALRIYGLPNQGIIFSDEATMTIQAKRIGHVLFEMSGNREIPQSFLNAKLLWLLLICFFQQVFNLYAQAGQFASCLFGILTVVLIYKFVEKVINCRTTAALSALLLAVSPDHVFYSRVGMPEVTSGFIYLFALFLFYTGAGKNYFFILLSGFLSGMNLLFLKYRALMFLFFPLIADFTGNSLTRKGRAKRVLYFLAGVSLFPLIFFSLLAVLKQSGINLPSLKESFLLSITGHKAVFDYLSLITFPYYLWKYGTPLIAILFFFSIMVKPLPRPVFVCWLIVIAQIFVSTLADEKGVRSLAPVLPFLAVSCAWCLKIFADRYKHKIKFADINVLIGIAVFINGLIFSWPIMNYRGEMAKAVSYISSRSAKAKILTTNVFTTALYSHKLEIAQIPKAADIQDLSDFYNSGYEWLITDPLKFIRNTRTGWNDPDLNELITIVEEKCVPEKIYKNFSRSLFERFAWEHTRPTIDRTIGLLKATDDHAGSLKVYSIETCLRKLEN